MFVMFFFGGLGVENSSVTSSCLPLADFNGGGVSTAVRHASDLDLVSVRRIQCIGEPEVCDFWKRGF